MNPSNHPAPGIATVASIGSLVGSIVGLAIYWLCHAV